ncbi:retrovirus-related pol polyprotein from transposon TNT 1-94 [Tanacetum coccineum]
MSIRELLLQEKLHKALQAICEKLNQQEKAANVSTHTPEPSRLFNIIYDDDDDDEESTIPLNEITSQIPPITASSVEDLVPIPSESEDTFESDDECDLSSCDDFSPIDVPKGKSVTFSNPLFDSNDDFTSSDDESLSDEDVPEDNVKIYSNPLFEFDDEYISSDVNPLFDEVLEDIKSKDSYVSNLDESALLVTLLSDTNEDECLDPANVGLKVQLVIGLPKVKAQQPKKGFISCNYIKPSPSVERVLLLISFLSTKRERKLDLQLHIMNGPYVRRMIPEPGDPARTVPVPETFHEQTDDELTVAEIKQMEADDQAIQTILLGLPEDIYAAVDSCETAQEIWLRVQQMMKGSDIGIQEKKAKLFNEWERFTSTDGESIESYYHRFSKLMNDFKRNKHFPEKIASNLKFLNNLQPEWSRHVTIVHQTKDLHTTDYTQLYDFLKYNQKEVDDQRAERLAKTHDPLALMANSINPFNYPVFHQDQPSSSTYMQQALSNNNNNYNPQPSFNQNYMQQPMPNPEEIKDPTTAMNMSLVLMAKAFKLNYSTPTNNNQRISSNPRNRQIAQPGMNMGQDRQMQMNRLLVVPGIANQNPNGNGNVVAARAEGNVIGNNGNQIRCYNCKGWGHLARNCTVRPRRKDATYLQTQLLIAQKEEA